MLRVSDLDVIRSRHRRARLDQVRWVQHPRAILALIAPRRLIATMRASADHIAVGQKSLIGIGVDLLSDLLLDEASLPQRLGELLGQPTVLR